MPKPKYKPGDIVQYRDNFIIIIVELSYTCYSKISRECYRYKLVKILDGSPYDMQPIWKDECSLIDAGGTLISTNELGKLLYL
jgi:hypothetical protein